MRLPVWMPVTACCLFGGATSAQCEEIVKTDVCQVVANPSAFDHKLVELTGYASEGMEEFVLSTRGCRKTKDNMTGIWLEYGGRRKSGTKYCCGATTDRRRASDLVVEGIRTSLVDDANLEAFDALVYPVGEAKVRLVGRYFAGRRQDGPGGLGLPLWGGYGHFGMFSLLVIQRVVCVEARKKPRVVP